MGALANGLRKLIVSEETGLRSISEGAAGSAQAGEGWSSKQEIGHLLDSAVNNRARFIRAALDGQFTGPSYDQRGWVEMGGYAGLPWADLVDLWKASNLALAAVVERIPEERLAAPCRIGEAAPVTLKFLIDDYILHMRHHLEHILAKNRPGDALKRAESS